MTYQQVSEEMIDAGCQAWVNAGGHLCDSADLVGPIYLAMKAKEPVSIEVERLCARLAEEGHFCPIETMRAAYDRAALDTN